MVGSQMAKALGKDDFQVIYHEGSKDSVQLSQVDERTVLGVMFDDRATLGMVRLYAKELAKKLQGALTESGLPVRLVRIGLLDRETVSPIDVDGILRRARRLLSNSGKSR